MPWPVPTRLCATGRRYSSIAGTMAHGRVWHPNVLVVLDLDERIVALAIGVMATGGHLKCPKNFKRGGTLPAPETFRARLAADGECAPFARAKSIMFAEQT